MITKNNLMLIVFLGIMLASIAWGLILFQDSFNHSFRNQDRNLERITQVLMELRTTTDEIKLAINNSQ
jgi:hypothetical protein